jgi:hypothetical protein
MTNRAGMRRRGVLAVVVMTASCLSYAVAAAETAPRTATRTTEASYTRAGGTVTPVTQPVLTAPGPSISSRSPENQVRVAVDDETNRAVAIAVEYQPAGSGGTTSQVYCGASPTLSIAVGSSVRVTPLTGTCPDRSPSVPTSGTIAVVFTRPLPPPPPPTIGPDSRWAVLIGVQDYAGNTHSTVGGRGDVSVIRTALLRSGWRSDHIRVLVDGQATGQAIINAMSWLSARSGPRTFSLFHFSGHVCIASRGPCPSGHTYLWGYDNRFVPETTVGSVLGRVQGRAWFDFAGCESGAFDAGLHSSKRLFSASSLASETSYEHPEWKQSVWNGLVWDQAFLQGHAGAAPNRANIGQMVAYGKAQAPRVTAKQARGPQHPVVVGGDPTQTLYAPRP